MWISILHAIKVIKKIYLSSFVAPWIRKKCRLLGNFSRFKLSIVLHEGKMAHNIHIFTFSLLLLQHLFKWKSTEVLTTKEKSNIRNGKEERKEKIKTLCITVFQLARNVSALYLLGDREISRTARWNIYLLGGCWSNLPR